METLSSPKNEYLLEASIDVLHYESKEWLSELAYIKDELTFFMDLLKSKSFKLRKEQQRQHILENMDKLAQSITVELENEIRSHEKQLAEMLSNHDGSDADFRNKHRQLKAKVERLINDIRTLKMLVFDLAEHGS
ncbi:MAG: hypothetical protein KatS3mg031_1958 [Chitinophagales bacterium]|nr:MAG: hypothetical protein KatS3mg031_1958 [Chitinophagales bacterium]